MSTSAGILIFRRHTKQWQFLLAHPGGPYWKNKDAGAWSIPKGEFSDEEPLAAALRELKEETGLQVEGKFIALTPRRQKSGKMVHAWGIEADPDLSAFRSNLFEMEWPPRSGRMQSFPEVDRIAWFNAEEAKHKILQGQDLMIDELIQLLSSV